MNSTPIKMQKVLLHLLLVLTALASIACGVKKTAGLSGAIPGSGNVLTETRQPGVFKSVTVEVPADVVVQQGGEDSVRIEADDNLLPQITSEVEAGKLTIKSREAEWDARVNPSKMVKITITAKNLDEIEIGAPIGTLEVNEWQAGALKLILSGGAQIKVSGIQVDLLEGILSGVGDMQISGTANETKLTLSGMGNLNAGDLTSRKSVVELSGTGDITVRVDSELKATVTGAGAVLYYGTPQVEQDIKGLGSIKPAD